MNIKMKLIKMIYMLTYIRAIFQLFKYTLAHLIGTKEVANEVVYFVEDDYLHKNEAITEMLFLMKKYHLN